MAVSQKLTLKETSVDTLANSSKVKIVWTSTQTGESHNDNTRTAKYWITINGKKTEYEVSYTLPEDTTKTILSRTITVPHREDGTGSVKVETWMDTRLSAGEVKLSKSLTLTTIARASTIGATDAYIESTSIIGINRKSDAYTHSVEFSFNNLEGYIDDAGNITNVEVKHTGSSIPFLIPPLFYDYIPNAPSGVCNLVCRTYSGDALIGSKDAKFTVSADPGLCRPVITCDVKDVNQKTIELTGDPDALVHYASTARCTVSAEPRNGATLVSMTVNGNETDGSLDVFNADTGNFVFTAKDSRGFVTEETVTKALIPYIPTTLNAKVTRTDPTSGNGILEVSGQCYAKSFGAARNEISATYSINNAIAKTAAVQISEDGLRYIVSEEISGLYYMSTSTVTVTISDAVSKKTQTVTVKPGVPVFDWGEHDFAFHVPVYYNGTLLEDLFLRKSGDTMGGILSMNGNRIVGLGAPQGDFDAVTKAYADKKTGVTKLWENPNPSSNFNAQTVELDLRKYDGVSISFKGYPAAVSVVSYGFSPKGAQAMLQFVTTAKNVLNRTAAITDTGVEFGPGQANGENSNTAPVPLVIYGWTGVMSSEPVQTTSAICGEFVCGDAICGT